MTEGLPPRLTAATGMDAMCHAIEALHSLQREPIADGLALHSIRLIKEFLPRAVENGKDMVARGQMLLASNMAGGAFSNAQVGMVHVLAHSVGARFGVHHGLANSILLPPCLRFNADAYGEVYLDILTALGVRTDGVKPNKTLHSNITSIAKDIDLTISLMFDRGRLILFNGMVKKPDLEIIADHETILELSLINFIWGIPNYFDRIGRKILKKLFLGDLKIKGMFSHPFQLICLTKLFSVN